LALAKAEREQRQRDNQRLLAEISEREISERRHWQKLMKPQAEKLAALMVVDGSDYRQVVHEAAGIGAKAWQTGGLNCMRELRDMALALYREKYNKKDVVDYIAFWWDGIGNWRSPSIG
jgi:hypothetical protein